MTLITQLPRDLEMQDVSLFRETSGDMIDQNTKNGESRT